MRYLFIPADGEGEIEVRETDKTDPYQLYRDETELWGLRLPTSHTSMFLFVAEEAALYNLHVNSRANKFWWGAASDPLAGPAIICMTKNVPNDIVIKDFPTDAHLNLVKDVLNS